MRTGANQINPSSKIQLYECLKIPNEICNFEYGKEAEQALTVWLPSWWINQIRAGLTHSWPLLGK